MIKRVLIIIGFSISFFTCKPLQPVTAPVQKPVSTIQLKTLVANDLSEDATRLSSKNDEIVLITVRSTGEEVISTTINADLVFNDSVRSHAIDHTFRDFTAEEQLSFFLLEIDEEAWNSEQAEQCAAWAIKPDFLANFYLLEADTLLGDNDLLGMEVILLNDTNNCQNLTFNGRQLFDRYDYRLELTCY